MRRAALLALAFPFVLSACNGDPSPGEDAGAPPAPEADRARARVIASPGDLIGGPKAEGRVGDLLLVNTKVRFIVAAGPRSRTWFPSVGALLDADRVRPAGEPGDDRLQEVVTRVGNLGQIRGEEVVVAHDGADGAPAVVRVTGRAIAAPFLYSVSPSQVPELRVVTEYRLAPYAESLAIVTTLTDESGAAVVVPAGDFAVLGDFVTLFAPGLGSDSNKLGFANGLRYFAAYGGGVSYAVMTPGQKIGAIVPTPEVLGLQVAARVEVPAKGSASYTRHLVVGTGDVASLLPEIVRLEGGDPAALGAIEGRVIERDTGTAVSGAEVLFNDATMRPISVATTSADGRFRAPLDRAGYSYTVSAPNREGLASGASDLTKIVKLEPIELTVTSTGRFTVDVKDDTGAPCPARLSLRKKDGSGAGYFLSVDGKGEALLAPGEYVAVVSRGYEWDAAEVAFTITAGQATPVAATLRRVVDTDGWIAIDPHEHTAHSVDSLLDPRKRVAQAAADGVELVITTEHDSIFDIGPLAREMGAGSLFATAVGCELSPVPGHINAYPAAISAASDTDDYWATKWWSESPDGRFLEALWPKDIFAAVRKKLGSRVVQLNHPRSAQGTLNQVGYDPKRGLASVDATRFDAGWDVIEVCNAGCDADPGSEDSETLRDLYSFLLQGHRKTGVGVSDAHGDSMWLGRARTLVEVRDDDPAKLAVDEVWDALLAGRAVVQDGAFVTATIKDDARGPVGPGSVARVAGEQLALHVKVQAPPWIPAERITIVQSGEVVAQRTITEPAGPGAKAVRFDQDIALPAPAKDAFYIVIVDADAPMSPVLGARPRTIVNAIYVDRDGNGAWDAPGL